MTTIIMYNSLDTHSDLADVLDALRKDGLAVCALPRRLAPGLRGTLAAVGSQLRRHYEEGGDRVCRGCVSLASFPERAQLRYVATSSGSVEQAAASGADALSQVALAVLGRIEGAPARAEQLLDAFWYPGEQVRAHEEGRQRHDGRPPQPCPAHTDLGLLTLIVDDTPGLEARRSDGQWGEVTPAPGECVIVAGRELEQLTAGRIPACVHRVRGTVSSRTSLAFELKLTEVDVPRVAAAAMVGPHEWVDEKYARAANALLGPSRPRAGRGDTAACNVM